MQLNAAGMRYQALLNQWTTKDSIKPKHTDRCYSDFEFRGFHGDYLITLDLPDGTSQNKEFSVEPNSSGVPTYLHMNWNGD